MKGFIEVTTKGGNKAILNLNNVVDFAEKKDTKVVWVGFVTGMTDIIEVEESYEEIKELIRNA